MTNILISIGFTIFLGIWMEKAVTVFVLDRKALHKTNHCSSPT
jgi:hypothetical protein